LDATTRHFQNGRNDLGAAHIAWQKYCFANIPGKSEYGVVFPWLSLQFSFHLIQTHFMQDLGFLDAHAHQVLLVLVQIGSFSLPPKIGSLLKRMAPARTPCMLAITSMVAASFSTANTPRSTHFCRRAL
jgi:hypothetical protein